MFGLGGGELLIIAAIVALLFGPTIVAFWIGYTMGRNRASEPGSKQPGPISEPSDEATEGPDDAI
jgi:Sec-independent protein translocase protein TatA